MTAVDLSAVARVTGIETVFQNLGGAGAFALPQRIMVIGQGATAITYATTKLQVTSALRAAQTYGFGSPIHLAVLELLPDNGDGVNTIPVTIYPLVDDGSGVASTGTITPAGSQTTAAAYRVRVAGILSEAFVIPVGAAVSAITALITAAVNAVLEMPVIAADGTTDVALVSKWKGLSANDIVIEIIGDTTLGTTFGLVQAAGGLVNPIVDPALAQVGEVWESLGLNCMNPGDTIALDTLATFGEGRWNPLVRKPIVFVRGNDEDVVATATSVTSVRKTDRTNSQLMAPSSPNLPFVIAARQLARIATLANNNPPHDYGSQRADGILPGPDGEQWDYLQRDQAVKAGSSTIEVKDGVVNISDVITHYAPTGEVNPPYRFLVDIIKLQQVIFNMDLIFATAEWDGAPLIPDDQATTNVAAKKPKMAKAALNGMIDALALAAVLADPEGSKPLTTANISPTNPKRLDASITVKLSGNTNIKSITLNFGFNFGTAALVA